MAGRRLAEGVNVLLTDPATDAARLFVGGDEVPEELAATVSNDAVWDEDTLRELAERAEAEKAAAEQAEREQAAREQAEREQAEQTAAGEKQADKAEQPAAGETAKSTSRRRSS